MGIPLGFMVSNMIDRQNSIKGNLYNQLVNAGLELDEIDYYTMQKLIDLGTESNILSEFDLENIKDEWFR